LNKVKAMENLEFKGTKGKWSLEIQDGEAWIAPSDLNANIICDIVPGSCTYDESTKTNTPVLQDEDIANATLIAAAPDLLESLQEILDTFIPYLKTRGEIGKMQIDRWLNSDKKALGK